MIGNTRRFVVAGMVLLALGAAGFGQSPATQPAQQSMQQSRVFDKQVTIRLNYLLYLPADYQKDAAKKWPLILFLHGAGERGDDINKVKLHGPPKILQTRADFPFIVASPQCPANSWWEPFALKTFLDEIQTAYRVDPDRVYLTGLSMGGFGTWDLAVRYPDRFAAIAPICGGGNPILAPWIKHIPVWVFHGDADPVVPVRRGDEMVEALKKVGADVRYTLYPGVGHDSWTATYDNPELYKWFLSHHRGEKREAQSKPASQPHD